jgi:cell division protease FtsH
VHKISIIPRGVAALGYTQQLPTDDRYLMQVVELNDMLAVLLGGRAAEVVVFDMISTGAGNDLERATDMARRMVGELGMSAELGNVTYLRRHAQFVNGEESRNSYSEETAQTIDREVKRIIGEQYERAIEILRRDRDILEALAQRLLQTEVVDRAELRELMGLPREA